MPKKKRSTARAKSSSVRLKGRGSSRSSGSAENVRNFGRYLLPLICMAVLLAGIGFFGVSAYRSVTSSSFFSLRYVDVRGAERTPAEDIRRIVSSSVEKPGVWNADVGDIRAKIEKFPFVKSAAVSMVFPAGIRVNVIERVPVAIVHLSSGNYLVDGEGVVLAAANGSEKEAPYILQGWDESKTEKAVPENLARLKLYRKMVEEGKQFDLNSRIKEVNLSNPREPVAVVEDSGRAIAVTLGKSLKTALEALSGKGAKIRSVDAAGISPVIQYLDF
jgi:cell division septal protein FtsQ